MSKNKQVEKHTDLMNLSEKDYIYMAPVSVVYTICPKGVLCQSLAGSPDSPSDGYGYSDMGEI